MFLPFNIILRDVGERLYLTPYIQSGNIEEARSLAQVTEPLTGLLPEEQPESYAGFITVKEATDSHTFFWFFPATVRFVLRSGGFAASAETIFNSHAGSESC